MKTSPLYLKTRLPGSIGGNCLANLNYPSGTYTDRSQTQKSIAGSTSKIPGPGACNLSRPVAEGMLRPAHDNNLEEPEAG